MGGVHHFILEGGCHLFEMFLFDLILSGWILKDPFPDTFADWAICVFIQMDSGRGKDPAVKGPAGMGTVFGDGTRTVLEEVTVAFSVMSQVIDILQAWHMFKQLAGDVIQDLFLI